MLTERMQRRVDRLLDEAEESADAKDWPKVRDLCNEVLGLDPDNADAPALLRASDRVGGAGESSPASTEISTEPTNDPPAPSHPSSFVAGRYRVERFLGEGGHKRVFLVHDTTLDRDVAFAQIRTEGLDDPARERVMREAQSMARLPVPRPPSIAQEASRG